MASKSVLPLFARLLVSVIFVTSAVSKALAWSSNVDYLAGKGWRAIPILLGAALLIESLGSLALIAGFAARAAASVMFLYMIPVTFLLHDFMSVNFQKNLGIMGALLLIASCGPGTLSVDGCLSQRHR